MESESETERESDSDYFDSFEEFSPARAILTRARQRIIMGDLEAAVQALADNVAKMGNQPPIILSHILDALTNDHGKVSLKNLIK